MGFLVFSWGINLFICICHGDGDLPSLIVDGDHPQTCVCSTCDIFHLLSTSLISSSILAYWVALDKSVSILVSPLLVSDHCKGLAGGRAFLKAVIAVFELSLSTCIIFVTKLWMNLRNSSPGLYLRLNKLSILRRVRILHV